jgi:hypothetical protein
MPNPPPAIYGAVAEFETPDAILAGARRAYAEGYRKMDAYSPFPVDGLSEAIGFRRTRMPLIVLLGGISGGITGYFLQYYAMVVSYPLNTGGRPLNSWPAFVPVTFELTILFAALAAVLGMFALNGLPMPYHPLFNVPRFATASRSRFFLCIESLDPMFDSEKTKRFLEKLKPKGVYDVEP